MEHLGWDAQLNRPASLSTGQSGEIKFAPPPQIETVLAQLERWQQAVQTEIQAESESSRALDGSPSVSTERGPTTGKETNAVGGDDIEMAAAMMAAAIR